MNQIRTEMIHTPAEMRFEWLGGTRTKKKKKKYKNKGKAPERGVSNRNCVFNNCCNNSDAIWNNNSKCFPYPYMFSRWATAIDENQKRGIPTLAENHWKSIIN